MVYMRHTIMNIALPVLFTHNVFTLSLVVGITTQPLLL